MIEGSNWGTIKESGGDCATAGQGPIEALDHGWNRIEYSHMVGCRAHPTGR